VTALWRDRLPLTPRRGSREHLNQRRARFESLFREHSGRVLDYALNRGMELQEAEDVVSDTFLVCWRRLDDVPGDALPWLLVTARKTLANHLRSKRRRDALKARVADDLAPVGPGPVEPMEQTTQRALLRQAVAELGEKDREAIVLVTWDGLSNAEAASVLGCSRAAFAVRSHRARVRLMKYLDDIRTY
jgi:RNA polymerase sigma factor (sigma-70 family)